MFCVLLGLVPPNLDVWKKVKEQIITTTSSAARDGNDDHVNLHLEWRGESLATDDGTLTLLVEAVSDEQATPESIRELVEKELSNYSQADDISCEVWASAPAPLPLRPLESDYMDLFQYPYRHDGSTETTTRDDSTTTVDTASRTMRQWGILVQHNVLNETQVQELRLLVDEAVLQAEQSLAKHRPDIVVGRDVFLFQEMASRNLERFDLRLTGDASDFVEDHILNNTAVSALLEAILGKDDDIDFDLSVVYSRPGACTQGWHADGNHQVGALDAGWTADGWKTSLADAYAVCMFIPLIDLDNHVGFTQFWPASHQHRDLVGFGKVAEITQATLDGTCCAGSAIWYDYRLLHRGMPNQSTVVRPVVQIIFKKKWYIEKANYGTEPIIADSTDRNSRV